MTQGVRGLEAIVTGGGKPFYALKTFERGSVRYTCVKTSEFPDYSVEVIAKTKSAKGKEKVKSVSTPLIKLMKDNKDFMRSIKYDSIDFIPHHGAWNEHQSAESKVRL